MPKRPRSQSDTRALLRAREGRDANEIAAQLVRLNTSDRTAQFRALPDVTAFQVFKRLAPHDQSILLGSVTTDEAAAVLHALQADDRARLLDDVSTAVAARLLAGLSADERASTRLLLSYPPESAGRVMTPDHVALPAGITANAALERVRAAGVEAEWIYQLYVVSQDRELIGVVSLNDLVLAEPGRDVTTLMSTDVVCAAVDEDQEGAARRLAANDLLSLPVVDEDGRLLGILTVDDAMSILEQEGTEDVARLGGSAPLDVPYLSASVLRVYRSRVGWLFVLFIAEALTGTVMRAFEETLESVVALAFFVPLMIGTGGNAGSQTTTTIVRAMATDEVGFADAGRIMWKEMRVGVLLGVSMAALGLVRATTWGTGGDLAFVVALGLMSVVLLATFVGSFLPLVLRRLRLDPAVVSAPFITTFVDATGLLVYFMLAQAILI